MSPSDNSRTGFGGGVQKAFWVATIQSTARKLKRANRCAREGGISCSNELLTRAKGRTEIDEVRSNLPPTPSLRPYRRGRKGGQRVGAPRALRIEVFSQITNEKKGVYPLRIQGYKEEGFEYSLRWSRPQTGPCKINIARIETARVMCSPPVVCTIFYRPRPPQGGPDGRLSASCAARSHQSNSGGPVPMSGCCQRIKRGYRHPEQPLLTRKKWGAYA